MALIKCSECEKEISDKATTCPNCGNPINEPKNIGNQPQEAINSTIDNKIITLPKKSNILKFIVGIIIFIIIAVIIYFVINIIKSNSIGSNLTNEEKSAIQKVQYAKDRLLDPDSFILYEGILIYHDKADQLTEIEDFVIKIIEYYEMYGYGKININLNNDTDEFYTYIHYGGKNTYGGVSDNIAVYLNETYLGTMKEADDELDAKKIKNWQLNKARGIYVTLGNELTLDSDSLLNCTFIDKDFIMKRIK